MKDDSLSDVAFYNTKEGMHIRAKELGVKAYSLGCSCPDCNDGFARMLDSVGKQDSSLYQKMEDAREAMEALCIGKHDNVYAKQIWNDAIEAAANLSEAQPKLMQISPAHVRQVNGNDIAAKIRRLKK